jgi:hypothetical protein
VAHQDTITATYADAEDGVGGRATATATARADLAAPEIVESAATDIISRAALYTVRVDEPATIDVDFQTAGQSSLMAPANLGAHSMGLVEQLVAGLFDLTPTTRYEAVIAVQDAVGNATIYGGGAEPLGFTTLGEKAVFFDDLEPGASSGWAHGAELGVDDWAVTASTTAKSPPHVWASADDSTIKDAWLRLPPRHIAPGDALIFWHTYQFEATGSIGFDGGVMEISSDYGQTWADLESGFLYGATYDMPLSNDFGNPLGGRRAFTGGAIGEMKPVHVSLTQFAGPHQIVRFRIGCDSAIGDIGWRIDDVRLIHHVPPPDARDAVSSDWGRYR